MKKNKVTLSKTVKLPIQGIQYSNKVVSAEVEFDAKDFDKLKAWDEIDNLIDIGRDKDPAWIKKFDEERRQP